MHTCKMQENAHRKSECRLDRLVVFFSIVQTFLCIVLNTDNITSHDTVMSNDECCFEFKNLDSAPNEAFYCK